MSSEVLVEKKTVTFSATALHVLKHQITEFEKGKEFPDYIVTVEPIICTQIVYIGTEYIQSIVYKITSCSL